MTEEEKLEESLRDEFATLGKNIRNAFTGVWESEERKRISSEIESGITEVGDAISQAAIDFRESESGQQVRADVERIADDIRTGEMREKFERDLVSILRSFNAELEKATENLTETSAEEKEGSDE